jgi:hypothetical protein
MTVTSRAFAVALDEIDRLTVSRKELFVVTELTVPGPKNWTDDGVQVPLSKFSPITETFWLTAPRPIERCVSPKMTGAALMPRQLVEVALAEPWVTVTFRQAVEALLETGILAVRLVALLTVVELTVMPPPEMVSLAPDGTWRHGAQVCRTGWVSAKRGLLQARRP